MAHGASSETRHWGHSLRAGPEQEPGNTSSACPGSARRGGEPGSAMGNLCGCGRRWKCPSPFKRKKEKQGAHVRQEAQQQQQPGSKAVTSAVPTYEDVPDVPVYATVSRRGVQQEESIHYADIQVLCRAQQRSAAQVRSLQQHQATEYATLNFPRARLKYDSKNGTLV